MQYQYPSYGGFRCVACSITFNNFDDQKQHYFEYHSRNVNLAHNTAPSTYKPFKQVPKANRTLTKPVNCDVCNISCSSAIVYDFHIKGKKHLKTLKKITLIEKGKQYNNSDINVDTYGESNKATESLYTVDLICKDCSVNCITMEQLKGHLVGIKHLRTLKMKRYAEMKEKKDPSVYCDICDMSLLEDLMTMHRDGLKHKRKCNETSQNEPIGKKRRVVTTAEHCGYCLLDLTSVGEAAQHYQSEKHNENVPKNSFSCHECSLLFNSEDMLNMHLKGFKHYARINQGNANPEGEMREKLMKRREKVKELKIRNSLPKFSYQDKYKFVSEPPVVDNSILTSDSLSVTVAEAHIADPANGSEGGAQ